MQYRKTWILAIGLGIVVSASGLRAHAQLPANFKAEDIGQPDAPGKTTVDNKGVWTITAGGSDIWSSSDQFQFAYTTLPGNGNVTMRFLARSGVADTAPAKSGPMMRASNAADAPSAFLPYQGDGRNMDPHYRFATGDQTTNFEIENRGHAPAPGKPIWQRVERQGNHFASLISEDGRIWTSLVDAEMPNMPATVLAGLAATHHQASDGDTVTATYDNVSVGTDLSPQNVTAIARDKGALVTWNAVPGAEGYNVYVQGANQALNQVTSNATKNTSVEVQNLENGKPATIVVTAVTGGKEGIGVQVAVIPAPPVQGTFTGINVNTLVAGSETVDANGVITLKGAGHAIGMATAQSGRADGFFFLAMPQTGNATATVRVVAGPTADRDDDNRQAGIMFRESLDQDARFVMMELTSGNGAHLQSRTQASAVAVVTDAAVADPAARPVWLRVVRNGTTLTAFVAEDKDGKNFRQVGDPVTINGFSDQAYVGLALSPHTGFLAPNGPPGNIEYAQAQFDNLSVK
jgi:regulation of enolase protein 1 (concanavalin A-like superfamily)